MSAQISAKTALGWPMPWGVLDSVDVDAVGLIRVFGWSHQPSDQLRAPVLVSGERSLELHKLYRTARHDVPVAPGQLLTMPGVVFEYLLPGPSLLQPDIGLTIEAAGHPRTSLALPSFTDPDALRLGYYQLLHSRRVFGRDEIYGYGPPATEPASESLALAEATTGSLLDFGCGAGALVAALRARGRDAWGLELDRPPIRAALLEEAAPYVSLYGGGFPAPFAAKSFDVVIATEVVEHIQDYRAAVAEIARLCRRQAILTVPDMSAIPLGHRHGLVPWHLLESTHVNFFTQESLAKTLSHIFGKVSFGRVGMSRINETIYFVSLVARCEP